MNFKVRTVMNTKPCESAFDELEKVRIFLGKWPMIDFQEGKSSEDFIQLANSLFKRAIAKKS